MRGLVDECGTGQTLPWDRLRRYAYSAVLLPSFYLDALVALGELSDDGSFVTKATGWYVGFNIHERNDAGQEQYATFLVTAKHVIAGRQVLATRSNAGGGAAIGRVSIEDANGAALWLQHDRFDIAATAMNVAVLKSQGIDVTFIPDEQIRSSDEMLSVPIGAGDDVFVLGFPMGMTGSTRNYGIARSGMIARLDRDIVTERNAYLVDSFVFPGNSGGPVALRPTAVALQGSQAVPHAHVIGLVSAYVPYLDVALSQQTQRPRVVFEENSGLVDVVPLEALRDLIAPLIAQRTAAAATTTKAETGQPEEADG